MRWVPLPRGWHVQQGMDLLPLRLVVADGQAHFKLFTCILSVWLHKVDKVPDRHDEIGGQHDEDVVVPVEGDGDI